MSDYDAVREETHRLLVELSEGLRGLDAFAMSDADRSYTIRNVTQRLADAAIFLKDVPRVPVQTHAGLGFDPVQALRESRAGTVRERSADCECYHSCNEDGDAPCPLHGDWHTHEDEPCPIHPEARMVGS